MRLAAEPEHQKGIAGMIWRYLIEGPWIVFVALWAISALKTQKTVSQESAASRYTVLVLEVLGFGLVFSDRFRIGVLADRITHPTYAVAVAGVALTWLGIAIAVWARWHLGQYWSARVAIKENHQLIRTGPYAHFRHPIYSGLDLAAIGGAFAIDRWGCLLGVGLIILGFWVKARREESMLSAQFGDAFEDHRRRTGFLLPRF